ncbi:MAG: ABC transporter ATP-binding protein [Candidatus Krumholzibacteriota bacterium]|nr:ABC transporter ATP-binding protein [Candidatus Krumholzibacteriota bacterium]
MSARPPLIVVEDLQRAFGDRTALSGVSLSVAAGSICGLIGPDGAGKTTLMRVLCGLLRPDAGRARVLDADCARESARIKAELGYMPQRFSLYGDLSVAENLRFFADLFGVPAAERDRREARLMEFSRLGPFRYRRAGHLSGGMKQKLALCCTLIHTPRVLLLDEPTTGVDPVSRQEFWAILGELREEGLALLVSTPYMDEADRCDMVILLHAGRVIARGTPQAVAAGFPRDLREIVGSPEALTRATSVLRDRGPAGLAVHRFGDRLHVAYDATRDSEAVASLLAPLGVQAVPVAPGIEDVFVELMGREQAVAR